MTNQIIHFNEGDVKVGKLLNVWQAWLNDEDHPQVVGHGSTMLEAIADLNEKLKERE